MRSIVIGSIIAGSLILATSVGAETLKGMTGPYAVVMEKDPTLPEHTIYRPEDLSKVRGSLPFIAWGNGGCANVGSAYQAFLGEVASRGYIISAPGPIANAPPPMPPPPAPGAAPGGRPAGPPGGMVQSKPGQMLEAISWAERETRRSGGKFQGKIDVTRIAVMGHSCGGLEAIAGAGDARVDTAISMNSGIIRGGIPTPDGGTRAPAGYLPATEVDIPKVRVPMLYVIGGPRDQAYVGAEADFKEIQRVPVFNANLPVGHGGTWREPGGGEMGRVALAWLDWRLKGDEAAGRMFMNPNCGLCTNAKWAVKKKNMG